MSFPISTKPKHFSPFISAAEELSLQKEWSPAFPEYRQKRCRILRAEKSGKMSAGISWYRKLQPSRGPPETRANGIADRSIEDGRYFKLRADEEDKFTQSASNSCAALVHQAMAKAYRMRLADFANR